MKLSDFVLKNGQLLENAIVESVSIDTEPCLTAWVSLKFMNGGCNFGGYRLDPPPGKPVPCKHYASEFLLRCIRCAGVSRWEDIKGKTLRTIHEGLGGSVVAIGHIIDDEWFSPSIEWGKK